MAYTVFRSQREDLGAGVLREASRRRDHLSRTLLEEGRCSWMGQVRDRRHTCGCITDGQLWDKCGRSGAGMLGALGRYHASVAS